MNTLSIAALRRGALAATVSVAMLSGCGQGDPAKLMASAKDYIAKNDYNASIIQLKNVLQNQPENGEARYLLGVSLAGTGDLASAEKEFRRALQYGYSAELTYPRLAASMLALADLEKMAKDLSGITLKDPAAQADLKSTLGEAYLSLGQSKQAGAAFASALMAQPGYPRARIGQARLLAEDRDLAGASRVTEEVLAESPTLPEALALKADLLIAAGEAAEAVEALRAVIRVQPHNGSARFALGSLLLGLKQYDQAAVAIDAMRKAMPKDIRPDYLEALLLFRKGEAAKAREQIQRVLRVAPDHAPSLLLAGSIELKLGVYGTAEDYLRRVLSKYPDNQHARIVLAEVYLRTGEAGKADTALEPALKRSPDDPTVLRLAGETALANNRLADAASYFNRALALDTGNAATRTRLAQVRLATGDTERAFKDLEQASLADSGQYQADLALISSRLSRREFDQALAAAATLTKKQPNNPLSYNVTGGIYMAKGDLPNARAHFEKALSLQFNYLPAARNLSVLDLSDRKPDDARKRFETILAKEPGNEGALLSLAEMQLASGAASKDILATLQRAVSANSTSATARAALIAHYNRLRDTKGALAAAQAASAALPDDPAIMLALGDAQQAAGETNQAIATYNKLVRAVPQSSAPLMRLANAYFSAKKHDAAIDALRKALEIQPDLIEAQREIVVVLVAAGRSDDALKEARDVQKARPKEVIGFALEGDVLSSQKKFTDASRAYAEGMKRQALPALAIRQHQALMAADQRAAAEAAAARWLKENPKDVIVRVYLADLDLRRQDFKSAARHLKEVVAIQPDNASALNNLAWSLSELKDPAALGYSEKAYALAPGNASVADTYGYLLVGKGETQRGVEVLTKAAAAAPNADAIRLHLAQALLKLGDRAGAKKELEAIIQLGNKSSAAAEAEQLLKQL